MFVFFLIHFIFQSLTNKAPKHKSETLAKKLEDVIKIDLRSKSENSPAQKVSRYPKFVKKCEDVAKKYIDLPWNSLDSPTPSEEMLKISHNMGSPVPCKQLSKKWEDVCDSENCKIDPKNIYNKVTNVSPHSHNLAMSENYTTYPNSKYYDDVIIPDKGHTHSSPHSQNSPIQDYPSTPTQSEAAKDNSSWQAKAMSENYTTYPNSKYYDDVIIPDKGHTHSSPHSQNSPIQVYHTPTQSEAAKDNSSWQTKAMSENYTTYPDSQHYDDAIKQDEGQTHNSHRSHYPTQYDNDYTKCDNTCNSNRSSVTSPEYPGSPVSSVSVKYQNPNVPLSNRKVSETADNFPRNYQDFNRFPCQPMMCAPQFYAAPLPNCQRPCSAIATNTAICYGPSSCSPVNTCNSQRYDGYGHDQSPNQSQNKNLKKSEPETQAESEAEPETQALSEAEPKTQAISEAEPETQAISEAEPETQAISEAEPETQAISEADPETQVESEIETKSPDFTFTIQAASTKTFPAMNEDSEAEIFEQNVSSLCSCYLAVMLDFRFIKCGVVILHFNFTLILLKCDQKTTHLLFLLLCRIYLLDVSNFL